MKMPYSVREVASGLGFIEGPVALADGRLLFADVGAGNLKLLDPVSGNVTIFATTGGGPNGIAVGPDGCFYVCNNGGLSFKKTSEGHNVFVPGSHGPNPIQACIQRVSPDGGVEIVYTHCGDNPLVAPNDLVFDDQGGFFFTDSGHPKGRLADLGGIYYARADGSMISELIHDPGPHAPPTQPNGCGLSPDGKRLYVAESGPCRLWSWNVIGSGVIDLEYSDGGFNGSSLVYDEPRLAIFDSLAIDSEGFICVGTLLTGGISVITPDGHLDAFVQFPEVEPFPTNICFGGADMKTAYVTASGTGKIFQVEWPRPGHMLNNWRLGAARM